MATAVTEMSTEAMMVVMSIAMSNSTSVKPRRRGWERKVFMRLLPIREGYLRTARLRVKMGFLASLKLFLKLDPVKYA